MSKSGSSPEPSSGRLVQLDGLRAFAAIAVVAAHCLDERAITWMNLGSLGVRLFFVLSGFLITGILLKGRASLDRGDEHWSRVLGFFYIRRSLRIFPLYYFANQNSALLSSRVWTGVLGSSWMVPRVAAITLSSDRAHW